MAEASTTATASPGSTTVTVASGVTTSEFWLHIGVAVAICIITALQSSSASLPPLAKAAVDFAAPIALAWLAKSYASSRSDVKTAAIAAGAAASSAVTTQAAAAAVLRGSP